MNPYKPFPRLVTRLTVPVTPHAARSTAASSACATACAATAASSAHVLEPQHSHTAQVKLHSIPHTECTLSETIIAQGIVPGYATVGRAPPVKRTAADWSTIKQTATTQDKVRSNPRTERTSSETIIAQGIVPGYATVGRAPPVKKIAVDQFTIKKSTADVDVAASAALAVTDKASTNSAGTIDAMAMARARARARARTRAEKVAASAIYAGARAEEVGTSAKASAPMVTLHVATADEVFPTSDLPPFNLEEIFRGNCNNSPIGYLVRDSAKAVFTQAKFEEQLKVFQSSVYKDCEWVSRDLYFKHEDRIHSACHQIYCLD
ncbi:hypothetical protein FBU31_004009 [Coemansia sp. 'formosensis']|nr:hypothetical protein FBU31_004009 [Coemansia sp. 'formosensis']